MSQLASDTLSETLPSLSICSPNKHDKHISATPVDKFYINTTKVQVPEVGLGTFIVGLTEENKDYNWNNLWWNLLPGAGQLFFLFSVIGHWWTKKHAERVFLYQNGFVKQSLNGKKEVTEQKVINFNDINGILLEKTRQYVNTYGIKKYNSTDVKLAVVNKNNIREAILTGSYRNEREYPNCYNFVGYACNVINNAWTERALKIFNTELATKGYGSFSTPDGEVQVGRDYIKAGGIVVSAGFKYQFNDGRLYLYPNAAEGGHFKTQAKPVCINISGMYNKDVFLMAVSQFHGIG